MDVVFVAFNVNLDIIHRFSFVYFSVLVSVIRMEGVRWCPNTPRVAFEWNLEDWAASHGKVTGQLVVAAVAVDSAAQPLVETQGHHHHLAFEAHRLLLQAEASHRRRY